MRHECRFVLPGERVIWVSVSTSRVPETPDRPAHLIMHIEDVSDRKRLEAELSHRALHDPLTGLANRTLLAERMREVLGRSGRHARPGHLFYLDLDGFKAVNDRFGHAAGDAVLTQLAPRIVALLRVGDIAARLGGDEFAVLCEDTEPHHAAAIADGSATAAADPFRRRRLDDHALGGGGVLPDGPLGRRRCCSARPTGACTRGKRTRRAPPRSPQPAGVVPAWICARCAVQYPDTPAPPPSCPICEDEREAVAPAASGGPTWPSSAATTAPTSAPRSRA